MIPVVQNQWTGEDTTRSRYKIAADFLATYNTATSAWQEGEVVAPEVDITLGLMTVDSTSNNWKLTQAVAEGSEFAAGWYKVPATVDGEQRDVLLEYVVLGNGGKQLYIYGHCFNATPASGKYPKQSFSIAKDAIMTPVVLNEWGTEDTTRSKYKLTEDFSAIYNSATTTWKEGVAEEVVVPEVTLSLKEVNAYNTWKFNWVLPEGVEFEEGFYRIETTVDGVARTSIIEYAVNNNGTKNVVMYNTYFNSAALNASFCPKSSFSIAKDVEMIPVVQNQWTGEDTTRSRYKITQDFNATYNTATSTWEEGSTQEIPVINITLGLMLVDSASNNWKFTQTVLAGSELATGWYKVPATVDGEKRDVLLEYAVVGNGSKQLCIYGHCFNATPASGKYPKNSFSIAKNAIMTPVILNEWGTEDTARSRYKIAEAFAANYNSSLSVWEEAVMQPEETTLNISKVPSWSSDSVFPMMIGNQSAVAATRWHSEINTADKATWKRVQGTVNIDGTEQQITIDFPGNGEMFFNISSNGKDKMIIKANTVFQDTNGNFRVKFDKDYEIYLTERLVYEEGKRPVEAVPIAMHMNFNKMANGTFDFFYSSDVEGHPIAGQFYHVTAIIDGVEKEILVQTGSKSGLVYIFEHCFASVPNKNSTPPVSNLKFEAGTLFYPVDSTSWAKNIGAQTYVLDEAVSVILVDNAWRDEAYYNKISQYEPLEVEVKLDYAKGKELRLLVVTETGKTLEEIYGNWSSAYGPLQRGVLNKEGGYDFQTLYSALYSLTKDEFFFNTIDLGNYDAIRIEAGTIIYPAEDSKSIQPIKIMNSFGVVRNAKDKWVLDEDYTTDYPGLKFEESTTPATNSSASSKKPGQSTTETTENTAATTNKDAKDTDKGVVLDNETDDFASVTITEGQNLTWIVSVVVIAVSSCAIIIIFLLVLKKHRKK